MTYFFALFFSIVGVAQQGDWYADIDLTQYKHIDTQNKIPTEAKKQALAYLELYKNKIPNQKYITVFDASKISSEPRLYLIDIESGDVQSLLVSHGAGSDRDDDGWAESFSNTINSYQTSLGFYITGKTYFGNYGYSLKLHGLEATNSNALNRSVVVHGAKFVDPVMAQTQNKIGRSQGCPAVEPRFAKPLIDRIRNGSILLIWKP